MNNDYAKERVRLNGEHTLIVNNFTVNDTGLYYCQRYESENADEKYNYLLDLVHADINITEEKGNFTDWQKYHDDYFLPVNELFNKSAGTEFQRVRNRYKLKMELITEWRTWGACEVCGRPQNESIRRKMGLCRIKLTHTDTPDLRISNLTSDEMFLLNANAVACRSISLGRTLPGISNLTRVIPDFVQYQSCQGTCSPEAEGHKVKGKRGKGNYKYRKSYVLAENSHTTIICPESTMDNVVVWHRNGKLLKPGESVEPPNPEDEPRITVDTFGTLYLTDIRDTEEGNYTCTVDDIKMEQVMIYVVSKSKLLTQAFVRYMMYLGFILSLTFPCYVAGIVIACCKRHKFKSYQQLLDESSEDDDN